MTAEVHQSNTQYLTMNSELIRLLNMQLYFLNQRKEFCSVAIRGSSFVAQEKKQWNNLKSFVGSH